MYLKGIAIYPIKSLDGMMTSIAASYQGGILGDRAFRIMRTADGKQMNAKIEPKLIHVRTTYDGPSARIQHGKLKTRIALEMEVPGEVKFVGELEEGTGMDRILSNFLGYDVEVRGSFEERYPDDPTNPGPSVVALSTLLSVAERFSLNAEEVSRRFRPNLILGDCEEFSEEQLVGKYFAIDEVDFEGRHVCRRCAVPTRDSRTGDVRSGFAKEFVEFRKEKGGLPVQSENELYRLCVRTLIIPSVLPNRILKFFYTGSDVVVR